jgi:SH3 domain-containing protein
MCPAMRRSRAPLLIVGLALACQSSGSGSSRSWWFSAPDDTNEAVENKAEIEVYRRAEAERVEFFEREITRLREDLARAEASIVAMESGLRGSQSRADAVSGLAEARIALDRVSRRVPWRQDRVEEARAKLTEGQRQLELDHVAAAVFFASRAQGIADSLAQEASLVAGWPGLRVVAGERVNLRAGPSRDHAVLAVLAHDTPVLPERGEGDWTLVRTPSGQVGWVHAPLLLTP